MVSAGRHHFTGPNELNGQRQCARTPPWCAVLLKSGCEEEGHSDYGRPYCLRGSGRRTRQDIIRARKERRRRRESREERVWERRGGRVWRYYLPARARRLFLMDRCMKCRLMGMKLLRHIHDHHAAQAAADTPIEEGEVMLSTPKEALAALACGVSWKSEGGAARAVPRPFCGGCVWALDEHVQHIGTHAPAIPESPLKALLALIGHLQWSSVAKQAAPKIPAEAAGLALRSESGVVGKGAADAREDSAGGEVDVECSVGEQGAECPHSTEHTHTESSSAGAHRRPSCANAHSAAGIAGEQSKYKEGDGASRSQSGGCALGNECSREGTAAPVAAGAGGSGSRRAASMGFGKACDDVREDRALDARSTRGECSTERGEVSTTYSEAEPGSDGAVNDKHEVWGEDQGRSGQQSTSAGGAARRMARPVAPRAEVESIVLASHIAAPSSEEMGRANEICDMLGGEHSLETVLCVLRHHPTPHDTSAVVNTLLGDFDAALWFDKDGEALRTSGGVAVYECSICFDELKVNAMYTLGHHFCYECMDEHLRFCVQNNVLPKCPATSPKCEHEMSEGEVQSCALTYEKVCRDRVLYRKYKKMILRVALQSVEGCIPCPGVDCRNHFVLSEKQRTQATPLQCEACEFWFCSMCREAVHYRTQCDEVDRLRYAFMEWAMKGQEQTRIDSLRKRNNRFVRDEKWKEENCRHCPACQRVISKVGGCDSMVCGQDAHGGNTQDGCGARFQWYEAKQYKMRVLLMEEVRELSIARGEEGKVYQCGVCTDSLVGTEEIGECIHCEHFYLCKSCLNFTDHDADHVLRIWDGLQGSVALEI